MVLRRAVFLDRDGTLNVEAGHINAPGNLQLYPGAAAAAGALRRAGYSLYIVTNQSQVGRGFATLEQIHAVNARLEELLRGEDPDATIDAIFLCPHAPDAACGCRKPAKGMVEELLRKNEIELGESWIVGDKVTDIEFGAAIGIPAGRRILLRTGHGAEQLKQLNGANAILLEDISEAAQVILNNTGNV